MVTPAVRLSDVIVPTVFGAYVEANTKVKTEIWTSGILHSDPTLTGFMAGGGLTTNVPFWNDLDDTEPNTANDDPDDDAVPGKVGASKMVAIRHVRTRGWAASRLTAELAGSDPMKRIGNRVTNYWDRQMQKHLVSTMAGVFADNIANDGGDMVRDIGTDAAGGATAAELVSAEAILDAAQTMGDASDILQVLIMHSVVYTRLAKANLIDFIPDSEGHVKFPTYLGYRIVKDDGVRKVAGANRIKYWTYLVGTGALAFDEHPVDVPVEVDSRPRAGKGMGMEELWTRRQYVLHPGGFKWTDNSRAGQFPTNAECEMATNWDRVMPERKQIPLAALVTNG